MTRSYARTSTSIWMDPDFRALNQTTQNTYFLLKSQAEISAAGALPLTMRRWSQMSNDATVESITAELAVLVEKRFVVVDENTEEVLVRTFVKWDGGYNNGKRVPVIREAAMAIASPILRKVLARELTKLGLSDIASQLVGDSPSTQPLNTPPDTQSTSDRVVVTEVENENNPQPSTSKGEPSAQTSDAPPPSTCGKHPGGTDEACGPCGTARRTYDAWTKAKADRIAAANAIAANDRARCHDCDPNGFLVDEEGRPQARCTHPNIRRTA